MSFEDEYDVRAVVAQGLEDPNIEGLFYKDGQPMLDRRYTAEAIARLGLSPRNADFNIIGPDTLLVPEDLVPERTEPTRGSVKSELLDKGLPGVNL